jgi:hypothetical protein
LRGADGRPQPYNETAATKDMRRDVLAHNAFLSTFSITVKHPDAHYFENGELLIETARERSRYVNQSRRHYYRVFHGRFDRGGRWYGPWWQLLPSRVRKGIRINGEKTCELNVRVCQLRLLCARAGLPPWNTGSGLWLHDIDAEVCARVQARLRADAIPSLSVHDTCIVPLSAQDRARAVMDEEFARACARLAERH